MGTPAVTPAPPAAPSAPSAPSIPAPSSTPAPAAPSSTPPASPAPTAPEAPAAPATPSGQPTPAAPAAPYDPKTAPAPPKATDYPNTTEGQAEFATQMTRWYKEHPEGEAAPAAAAPETPKTPEEQALADAQPADAKPPAAPEVAPTPQALAELMDATPEFKDLMEAKPEIKGKLFKMARELAEIAPIREIVPTVEDAKFMQEYTTNMVGLKTASLRMVDNPENAPAFVELFDSQFQRVDAQGNPILDAQGRPTYDADRDAAYNALFGSKLKSVSQPIATELATLKAKLEGTYPSEFARQQDQQRYDNLEYAQTALSVLDQIMDGTFFEAAAPQPPADATPEQKAWFEQQKSELDRRKQELEDKQKGASKEERATQAKQFHETVRGDMGTAVGTVIDNQLKAIKESGVYIPEFYMQEKYVDPATGKETNTSALAARVFLAFDNELMKPGSRTLLEMTQHELLPQNEQTREMRKAWFARKAAEMVPGIWQKEIDRIQSLVQLDQQNQAARLKERNRVAQPEPHTGGSSLPQGASDAQVLAAAEEAAKRDPGWEAASPSERQARILTQRHRMMRGK